MYSGDCTRASCVNKSTVTRVLRSRSVSKKEARSKEHEIVDLDAEESASERVDRLITHQAGSELGAAPRDHLTFAKFASPLVISYSHIATLVISIAIAAVCITYDLPPRLPLLVIMP